MSVLLTYMEAGMSNDTHPDLVALGEAWISAWNSRDLDRILALYAEDAEMTSDGIVRLGFTVQGSVTPLGFITSPNSVVVHYTNDRGQTICEYLRVGQAGANAGLIVQGSANHLG
jgi:hypothetical protein